MVQADVRQLLLTADLNLRDDNLEVFLEAQAGGGRRIDVEVGATVIEVKRDLRVGNVRVDAAQQLEGYVQRRQAQFGRRYVGIVTDGAEWHCYHLEHGHLVEVSEITVVAGRTEPSALLIWLEGVLATARDLRPTPEQIAVRLGAGSSAHALDRATLAALYAEHKSSPGVRTKRRLWARLLETALGTQFEDSDELFIEHTLLVNSAEIIAHAVLGLDVESVVPASLLSGAKFDESGIHGVVEADFFDWVVGVANGDAFVRTLGRRLARFDWSSVEHDVLKVLYESVITAETRKKLGEYYTPDWLAERLVAEAVVDPLAVRVLDPACGSGTFLFHAVRRYLAAADANGTPLAEALRGVTRNVLGMDLHPVAVTLARVTYLLALGRERLVHEERGPIQVPVYLGDSLQWRQKSPTLWSDQELTILADDERELFPAQFRFPSSVLKDTHVFDELVKELATRASAPTRLPGAKAPSLAVLLQRLAIPEEAKKTIAATFQTMCRLHDEGRDHIWGYYIRNLARPEWLARVENRVDVLVGNPPWLSYRFMPAEMQEDFREMSEARSLWRGAKVATHQDLSGLFVVRAVELYLKAEGRFAFVMPNAVVDREQFEGFRAGNYDRAGGELRVSFFRPWDFRRIRPHFFPRGAAAVFGARTGSAVPMPGQPEVWIGRLPTINASWEAVAPHLQQSVANAGAVPAVSGSPYRQRFRQGATIVPRVLFMVEKMKAGPLGQVAGRAAIRSVRSANEKKPWKHLPALEGVVETEFLRPIHLGETVLPYRILEPRLAVVPRDAEGLLDSQNERIERYPGLTDWCRRAEQCWNKNRSSERLTLAQRLNFHGELESQFAIQPQRVVYVKAGMHLAAARLADRRAVVDHKLYWASAATVEEAHYLCAILNAAVTTKLVRPLMSYGKDERDVDKHIWTLPIPMFDPGDKSHAELAELGKKAEEAVGAFPLDLDKHFAASRRAVRDYLETSAIGQRIEELVTQLLG
ncbi:MAG: N-6 DNA methylase [Polyangiaceae bacterium]|nr:N-6 DNA methylase [Polyangiaceae bacterium]